MHIPGDVGLHRVHPQTFQFFQPVPPVLRDDPEIMDAPGNNLKRLSVQVKCIFHFKGTHVHLLLKQSFIFFRLFSAGCLKHTLKKLLYLDHVPTAFIGINDSAVGVMNCIPEQRLWIPDGIFL